MSLNSDQFHSDNSVMLLCTINLPVTVNSEVTIATVWVGPNGWLTNSSDVTISNTYEITDGVYQSSLTISNFVTSMDNGDYRCNATIATLSPYIIGDSAIGRRTVNISGWYFSVNAEIVLLSIVVELLNSTCIFNFQSLVSLCKLNHLPLPYWILHHITPSVLCALHLYQQMLQQQKLLCGGVVLQVQVLL